MSPSGKERTAELCDCPIDKLRAVYHGVDHENYHPRGDAERDRSIVYERLQKAAGRAERRPFFLCLGAVTARKNVPLLLEAFSRSKVKDDYCLVLAGQSRSETPQILARLPELKLQNSVIPIGHVSPAEVPSFLRLTRALVHASRYESFGLPLIEAMACGAPVVCSNTSAMPEITGGAAYLFHPDEVDTMSAAMDKIASNNILCEQLRAKGIARASEFTWERAAGATLATYREVLEKVS